MDGKAIHAAMLERCEVLMDSGKLSPEQLAELVAVAAACEAYEAAAFPISQRSVSCHACGNAVSTEIEVLLGDAAFHPLCAIKFLSNFDSEGVDE